ncbi:MAG: helix-turn-helix transcriptional regulator [Clostridia bacterium]|nr:helix-turn-helix transcriptional regulator [Clostridia bacterium]
MYGERLRKARKEKKLTLTEVADLLHTTHATISRYENEKINVDAETLAVLCRLYHVSADYILGLPTDLPYPEEK